MYLVIRHSTNASSHVKTILDGIRCPIICIESKTSNNAVKFNHSASVELTSSMIFRSINPLRYIIFVQLIDVVEFDGMNEVSSIKHKEY